MRVTDEWTPDTFNYPQVGLSDCNNVYVRSVEQIGQQTSHEYAPFGGPSYFTDTNTAKRVQGWVAARDPSGASYNFCGDANNLYLLRNGILTNVSKTTDAYSTPSDGFWTFTVYGNRVVASNGTDPIQTVVMGADAKFSDLSTGAPLAKYVATIKDFVVTGCINGMPNGLQWSGIDQPTLFPPVGSGAAIQNQSDQQIMPDGGWVQGVVGGVGGVDGLVFLDTQVWRMQYAGYPAIFDFQPIERSRGTPAPGSIANQGAFVAYLAPDGFYVCDGFRVTPIGLNKIDKWFWATANQNFLYRMSSVVDTYNRLIIWSFPSTASHDGTPDTLLIYNWAYQKWTKASFPHEFVGKAMSEGYTLEMLNNLGSLDTLPYSLDSRIYQGGTVNLAVFCPNTHALGYIVPTLADSSIVTGMELDDGGTINHYQSVRAITDAPIYGVQVESQYRLSDTPAITAIVYNNSNGECPVRASGRYVSINITIPSGQNWTHLTGYEVKKKAVGKR